MYIHIYFIIIIGYSITEEVLFLAWKTWDLLRIMYYGFKEFVEYFLERFPGLVVYPSRFTGSAIESYFSCLRAISGGNLNSCNYASSSATAMLRSKTNPKCNDDYRKAKLSFRQHTLTKRRRKRKLHKK